MHPAEFEADYHRAAKWRARWAKLADTLSMKEKENGGRLQSKQEHIERRARLADIRCGNAIRDFHKLVNQDA